MTIVASLSGAGPASAQDWDAPVVTRAPEGAVVRPVARTAQFAAPQVLELPQATVSVQPWSSIITGAIGSPESPNPAPDPISKPQAKKPVVASPTADEATRQKAVRRLAESAVEQSRAPMAPTEAATAMATPATPAAPATPGVKPLESLPPDATPVQQYCFNTSDAVADARAGWQAKKIADAEGELEKRIATLDAKTEELKTWLARRDEFIKRAHEKLVGVYTRMRPDAAALQLAEMDEETAAAVLTKLEIKSASAVMNEMEPEKAARIASIISGSAKVKPKQAARAAAPAAQAPAATTPGADSSEAAAKGAKS